MRHELTRQPSFSAVCRSAGSALMSALTRCSLSVASTPLASEVLHQLDVLGLGVGR